SSSSTGSMSQPQQTTPSLGSSSTGSMSQPQQTTLISSSTTESTTTVQAMQQTTIARMTPLQQAMVTSGNVDASQSRVDCNGKAAGKAYRNQCGVCVSGETGNNGNSGMDDSINACMGCDNMAFSPAKSDRCGQCLNPNDARFNQG